MFHRVRYQNVLRQTCQIKRRSLIPRAATRRRSQDENQYLTYAPADPSNVRCVRLLIDLRRPNIGATLSLPNDERLHCCGVRHFFGYLPQEEIVQTSLDCSRLNCCWWGCNRLCHDYGWVERRRQRQWSIRNHAVVDFVIVLRDDVHYWGVFV